MVMLVVVGFARDHAEANLVTSKGGGNRSSEAKTVIETSSISSIHVRYLYIDVSESSPQQSKALIAFASNFVLEKEQRRSLDSPGCQRRKAKPCSEARENTSMPTSLIRTERNMVPANDRKRYKVS